MAKKTTKTEDPTTQVVAENDVATDSATVANSADATTDNGGGGSSDTAKGGDGNAPVDKLREIANTILGYNPDATKVYFTSDGIPFLNKNYAEIQASHLDDKEIKEYLRN